MKNLRFQASLNLDHFTYKETYNSESMPGNFSLDFSPIFVCTSRETPQKIDPSYNSKLLSFVFLFFFFRNTLALT